MKFREDAPKRSASSEDPWGACKKALAGPLGTEIKEMMRAATEANEIADGPIKTPTGRNTARRRLADSLQRVAAALLASVEPVHKEPQPWPPLVTNRGGKVILSEVDHGDFAISLALVNGQVRVQSEGVDLGPVRGTKRLAGPQLANTTAETKELYRRLSLDPRYIGYLASTKET